MRASSSGTARKRLNERSSVLESGRGKLVIDFNRGPNSPELWLACEGITEGFDLVIIEIEFL